MTEYSYYWGGTAVGDATLAPYDDDEFSDNWNLLHTYDRTVQGVIDTAITAYSSMLACTNPTGTTIRIANGAALVDGKLYKNTANVDFSVTAPGAGTNYYTIVLQKDFAAQTVRLEILGPDAGAYPTVTQTDGTLWEIEIWNVSITAASAITIVDKRKYIDKNQLYYRQGGSATDWSTQGTNNYATGTARIQCGIILVTIPIGNTTGGVTITFPTPFSNLPIAFTQTMKYSYTVTNIDVGLTVLSTTQMSIIITTSTVAPADTPVWVAWMAIGPQ